LGLLHTECHATGTAVGDVIELKAVGETYGKAHSANNLLRVASVKSNIGHAEIAAGIFSVTKVRARWEVVVVVMMMIVISDFNGHRFCSDCLRNAPLSMMMMMVMGSAGGGDAAASRLPADRRRDDPQEGLRLGRLQHEDPAGCKAIERRLSVLSFVW
jgi:hypothetical protein